MKAVTPTAMCAFFKRMHQDGSIESEEQKEQIKVFQKKWNECFQKAAPAFLQSGEMQPRSSEYLPAAAFIRFCREPELKMLISFKKEKSSTSQGGATKEETSEGLPQDLDPFSEIGDGQEEEEEGEGAEDSDHQEEEEVDDEESEEEEEDEGGVEDELRFKPPPREPPPDGDGAGTGGNSPRTRKSAASKDSKAPEPKKKASAPKSSSGKKKASETPDADLSYHVDSSNLFVAPGLAGGCECEKIVPVTPLPIFNQVGENFGWFCPQLPRNHLAEDVKQKAQQFGLPVCTDCCCRPSWHDGDDLFPRKERHGQHCEECEGRGTRWDTCCCWLTVKDRILRGRSISFSQFQQLHPDIPLPLAKSVFTKLERSDPTPSVEEIAIASLFQEATDVPLYVPSEVLGGGSSKPQPKPGHLWQGQGRKLGEEPTTNLEYAKKLLTNNWFKQECQKILQEGGKHQREVTRELTAKHGNDPVGFGPLNQGVLGKYARLHEGFHLDQESKMLTTKQPLTTGGAGRILPDSRGIANRQALLCGKKKRVSATCASNRAQHGS
jgi:hypothetical protein